MGNSYTPSNFPFTTGAEDDIANASLGGHVITLKAAAALKLGDAVFLSAALTVNKSATAGDNDQRIGIVVGGTNTNMSAMTDVALYNSMVAADANEQVLVLVRGISYVITDAAITLGLPIALSNTVAGRVRPATVTSATGANPTQAATTATQSGTTAVQTGTTATVPAGATPVTSSSAQPAMTVVEGGIVVTDGAIVVTNGAITAGAITVAGDGANKIIGMMLETSSGAGAIAKALIYQA